MSRPTKFDAALAERNARVLAEQIDELTLHLSHAREDLADYAERVAERERERAMYEDQWRKADNERTELMARLAQARVEGAREALVYLRQQFDWRPAVDKEVAIAVVDFALRTKHPAPSPVGGKLKPDTTPWLEG